MGSMRIRKEKKKIRDETDTPVTPPLPPPVLQREKSRPLPLLPVVTVTERGGGTIHLLFRKRTKEGEGGRRGKGTVREEKVRSPSINCQSYIETGRSHLTTQFQPFKFVSLSSQWNLNKLVVHLSSNFFDISKLSVRPLYFPTLGILK